MFGFHRYSDVDIATMLGGLSHTTVERIKKCWHGIVDALWDPPEDFGPISKIGGPNVVVEVDEALMGKKHGMQPFGNNNKTMKIWVVGCAERFKGDTK